MHQSAYENPYSYGQAVAPASAKNLGVNNCEVQVHETPEAMFYILQLASLAHEHLPFLDLAGACGWGAAAAGVVVAQHFKKGRG